MRYKVLIQETLLPMIERYDTYLQREDSWERDTWHPPYNIWIDHERFENDTPQWEEYVTRKIRELSRKPNILNVRRERRVVHFDTLMTTYYIDLDTTEDYIEFFQKFIAYIYESENTIYIKEIAGNAL